MSADPTPLLTARKPILAAALNLVWPGLGFLYLGRWTLASNRNDLTLPFGTLRLGADEYYLLGDNRDSSEDSRFFGAVPLSSFQGRGEFIAFSYDSGSGLRVERIGRRLR